MYFIENLLIDADPFYTPRISISPFSSKNLPKKPKTTFNTKSKIEKKLKFTGHLRYTISGKEAIEMALNSLNLENNETISIVTTTGNSYVSRCVTETINKFCHYEINPKEMTKVVYLIHEFGNVIDPRKITKLIEDKHFVINDYAYSLLTILSNPQKFHPGHISVLSFPKHFPINFGGALLSEQPIKDGVALPDRAQRELLKVINREVRKRVLAKNATKRRKNSNNMIARLDKNFFELFRLGPEKYVPSVLMIKVIKDVDLFELREYMNRQGIESSAFFGFPVYFLPNHQNLEINEIRYITDHLNYFVSENDK
jgi:hypothetical protein